MRGYRPTGDLDEDEEVDRARPRRPAPGKVTRTMRMEGRVIARRSTGYGDEPFDLSTVAGLVERSGGGGEELPASLRGSFEESLGIRLADVRVHTDAVAAGAARSIQARAFTVGQDIYFGAGQYDPRSPDGKRLLAHEVAHTAQQRGAGVSHLHPKLEVTRPGDAVETEADAAADAMVAGRPATVSGTAVAAARTEDPAAAPAQPTGVADGGQDAQAQGKNDLPPLVVTVTVVPSAGKMEYDAADYLELYKQVSARAQSNACAGQCTCGVDQDYSALDKNKVTITVNLETTVPTWKQRSSQPKEHQEKFDRWAASVKVHEDAHAKMYTDAYATLKDKMKSCADQAACEAVFKAVDEKVEKDQKAFDADASKQPAPLDIPGGTQKINSTPGAQPKATTGDHAAAAAGDPGDAPPIQRKALRAIAPAEDVAPRLARGGGEALPGAARARLETGLGVDLGGVRLHTDGAAAAHADALAARAFTSGQDIYFAAGELAPDDADGFRLLAHEVVHTVQQRAPAATAPAAKGRVSQPEDAAEREADEIADRIAAGVAAPVAVVATPAPLSRKGRTAKDLDFPETSDPWMFQQAQRNVAKPTPGWIGGAKSVTHADMLGLGYEYRGVDGNFRRYHVPGTDPAMIFNIIINPEVDPDAADAPDPNDPTTPTDADPPALREAKQTIQEWSRLTKQTLPIYDRLRALRGQGLGETAEYDQLIDQANDLFDQAKEVETDYQDGLPDWREELADDPDALSQLDNMSTGDVAGLRTWVDDFDQNRDADGNRRSDEKWKQMTEELEQLKEELENPPPEEAPEESGDGEEDAYEDKDDGDEYEDEDDDDDDEAYEDEE